MAQGGVACEGRETAAFAQTKPRQFLRSADHFKESSGQDEGILSILQGLVPCNTFGMFAGTLSAPGKDSFDGRRSHVKREVHHVPDWTRRVCLRKSYDTQTKGRVKVPWSGQRSKSTVQK
jgi:hypothetical protein